MSLTLEPVSIADRAAIADVIIRANFDDPYGKTVWPNSTLESRIAGSYARLANTLLGEGAWFMKCVDTSNGQIVAYAQWTLPIQLWEKFRLQHGGGVQAQVTDDMRKRFELESIESCTSEGEPRGMRIEVVEHCSPAMVPARNVAFPEDEEYIMLDQVKTLPSQQRRGAGSLLVQWGVDLANREELQICLEATSFDLRLYEKHGFETKAEVHHDVSKFGGPSRYTHCMMVKQPDV